MNFKEATDFIFSFSSLDAKPSLERIKTLLKFADDPQNSFESVHIAGTNGKGSVATYIASVLTECGYKTGLFTSPHIVSFCERIKVDGEMISEEDVARLAEKFSPIIESVPEKPTAFDLITAIGLEYFREKKCDFAILECGLGGKFDSTNVVTPKLSVLCSISLDHLGVLGNTIEEITEEKCGIIKQNVPVVSYPFEKTEDVFNPQHIESQKIIEKVSCMRQSELIVADPKKIISSNSTLGGTCIQLEDITLSSHLPGVHQKANMLTAYTALSVLSRTFGIPTEKIISGFSKAKISARFETLSENPTVIVDGGHNADCARALRLFIETTLKGEKLTAVTAMMRDKQCDEVIKETAPLFKNIIVTEVKSPRACDAYELSKKAEKYGKNVTVEPDAYLAIKKALEVGNTVIIYGSFYLAGDAKKYFSR